MTITTTHTDTAERQLEWHAPTGRLLTPGTLFKHRRGRPSEPDAAPGSFGGRWRFLAYVDHPTHPHVEAVAVNGPSSVRAFDPADVYNVSNAKGAAAR